MRLAQRIKKRRMVRNVFCATGPGGGIDPTCSPNEFGNRRFTLHSNPKTAAKAISLQVTEWAADMAKQGRLPGDPPSLDEVEKNWMKVFRSKKGNEGNLPAFTDLNQELKAEIERSIESNESNAGFQEFVGQHGDVPIIYRRPEVGRSCAAEWRGAIHIYDSPFWKGEAEDHLLPGGATAGGMCGYAGVIRHEYGHKLYGKLTLDQQRQWSAMVPDSDKVSKGVTSYAAKNREETFCEVFAITTDKRYKPGIFPKWVDELHAAQKKWLLK